MGRIIDSDGIGPVVLVEIKNGLTPVHVRSVQALASCIRKHLPHLSEKRPMYQEFQLDKDPGLGGNNPTHLAPFISIFLPEVVAEMYRTLEMAFESAGWGALVARDELMAVEWGISHPRPVDAGMRASEHLTYSEFPLLAMHHDGANTAYTMNFAFSDAEDYTGGVFTITDAQEEEHSIKPDRYSSLVFLGGEYKHGVSRIYSGHREMYSTELWNNPDIPIGSNLWSATSENMQTFIDMCNEKGQTVGDLCNVTFSEKTDRGLTLEEIKSKYDGNDKIDTPNQLNQLDEWDQPDEWIQRDNWNEQNEWNEQVESDETQAPYNDGSYTFLTEDQEPHFLVPLDLAPGEMAPLTFRHIRRSIQGEAYTIALPVQLLEEFQAYIRNDGMMELAQKLLYKEKRLGEGEHKIHTLNDGMKWGAMNTGWESNTDMIWLDPADEECFESLLSVLRRGGFDVILESVGRKFNLDSLMIQGIGAIFLSHFDHDEEYRQMHVDIPGSQGTFYNVVVPIHIPQEGAKLYVGDDQDWEALQMRQNLGTLVGGNTLHGSAECDYRETGGFRLSFAIYLADVSEENLKLIASDSTSLWPTQGDVTWFRAQKGRLWNSDGKNSLREDIGRKTLTTRDEIDECPKRKELCEEDPTEFRLKCPLTCKLYLEDEIYYQLISKSLKSNL